MRDSYNGRHHTSASRDTDRLKHTCDIMAQLITITGALRRAVRLGLYPDAIRRLGKGTGTLLSGSAIAGLLALLSLTLTARALPTTEFGLLAVLVAYGVLFTRLLAFQTTRVFIHLGAEAQTANDRRGWLQILVACIQLDQASALLAALLALAAIPIAHAWWTLPDHTTTGLFAIALSVATSGTGFAIGLLRFRDRFATLASHAVAMAALKCAGVFVISRVRPDLVSFAIWTAIMIAVSNLTLIVLAWRALTPEERRQTGSVSGLGALQRERRIVRMFLLSNLDGLIRALREMDIPVVAFVAGAEQVAFYRIARQVAAIPQLAFDQLVIVAYPDLARLAALRDRKAFTRLIAQSSVWVGTAALVVAFGFVLVGPTSIVAVFGESYRASYGPAVLALFGVALYGASQSFGPALQALGRFGTFAAAHSIVTVIYVLATLLLASAYGALGAAGATLVMHGGWAALSFSMLVNARKDMVPGQRG